MVSKGTYNSNTGKPLYFLYISHLYVFLSLKNNTNAKYVLLDLFSEESGGQYMLLSAADVFLCQY